MGTVSRPNRRPKLTDAELANLYSDLAERLRLRPILTEHCKAVLSVEFGISESSIDWMDRLNYDPSRCPRIGREIVEKVAERRKIYWQAREIYDERCKKRAIMARYNISGSTLARRQREMREMMQRRGIGAEERRAA